MNTSAKRALAACALLASTSAFGFIAAPAAAQDAATTVEAFNVPVFEQVDGNGVDLVSGMLRVSTPVLEAGSDEAKVYMGLQWMGKAWSIIERPTIWRDGDKYIVNYRGKSEEFNDRSKGYSQRRPITGAALTCTIFEPGNLASECIYTSRDGDVVHFKGRAGPFASYSPSYGQSSYAWGNLGMAEARLYSVDNRDRQWGAAAFTGFAEGDYNLREVRRRLGDQVLTITTPNHDGGDADEHYLRPKGTTQTITDSFGSAWRYTFNNDRRLTGIVPPGGASPVTITYSDGRVKTVTNAAGTWNYSYALGGDYGVTTVTSPLGGQTVVTFYKERGYVTKVRDELLRSTIYDWDSGYRLSKITYPELNTVEFKYDGRGNVILKTTTPKPALGGPVLTEEAGYDGACLDIIVCNKPRWTTDARGKQTDYEYTPSATETFSGWFNGPAISYRRGTGKPVVTTSPADLDGIRPQVRNTYTSGLLTRSSACITQQSCAGTGDEVVTTYGYGGTEAQDRLLYEKSVNSQGRTLRTCYGYDGSGNRISETPPIAGLGSCPTGTTPPNAVTATKLSAGVAPVPPTFPDAAPGSGGGGGGGDGGGGGGVEPTDPPCGPGTGKICP